MTANCTLFVKYNGDVTLKKILDVYKLTDNKYNTVTQADFKTFPVTDEREKHLRSLFVPRSEHIPRRC